MQAYIRHNTNIFLNFSLSFFVGLSHANLPDDYRRIDRTPNVHAFSGGRNYCYSNGKKHNFEWQEGAKKPVWNDIGDVLGCGLLLSPTNKVDIFFTGNGVLMGQFPWKFDIPS
jgi:hypothetical protein